ncbi:MAG: hypothetical protein AAFY65_16010 [Pseudomonadota bacterium]
MTDTDTDGDGLARPRVLDRLDRAFSHPFVVAIASAILAAVLTALASLWLDARAADRAATQEAHRLVEAFVADTTDLRVRLSALMEAAEGNTDPAQRAALLSAWSASDARWRVQAPLHLARLDTHLAAQGARDVTPVALARAAFDQLLVTAARCAASAGAIPKATWMGDLAGPPDPCVPVLTSADGAPTDGQIPATPLKRLQRCEGAVFSAMAQAVERPGDARQLAARAMAGCGLHQDEAGWLVTGPLPAVTPKPLPQVTP